MHLITAWYLRMITLYYAYSGAPEDLQLRFGLRRLGRGPARHAIQPMCAAIRGLFEGFNATVLAYGQTGSGKTCDADLACLQVLLLCQTHSARNKLEAFGAIKTLKPFFCRV